MLLMLLRGRWLIGCLIQAIKWNWLKILCTLFVPLTGCDADCSVLLYYVFTILPCWYYWTMFVLLQTVKLADFVLCLYCLQTEAGWYCSMYVLLYYICTVYNLWSWYCCPMFVLFTSCKSSWPILYRVCSILLCSCCLQAVKLADIVDMAQKIFVNVKFELPL